MNTNEVSEMANAEGVSPSLVLPPDAGSELVSFLRGHPDHSRQGRGRAPVSGGGESNGGSRRGQYHA